MSVAAGLVMPAAPAGEKSALVVDGLVVEAIGRTQPTTIVRGVSLGVPPGTIVGLIGESGSGKTMTCRAIVDALPNRMRIAAGEIRLGATIVRGAGVTRSAASPTGIGMIFADPHASLDPLHRVGPQVAEVLKVHHGVRRGAATRATLALLERVSLPDPERVYRQYPFQLSGGMAQRAMLASVLAMRPRFILADEPTSALDATIQLEVLDLLRGLTREEGVGILLTTHDITAAARVCERIGVMYAGKIVEEGPADIVLTAPQHPYTRLLLHARPRGTKSERLQAIPGEPVSPAAVVGGCAFAPRCPRAQEVCVGAEPPLEPRRRHLVACHFPFDDEPEGPS